MERLDTLQKIEIGEGVEIRLRLAGPAIRATALLIDYLIKAGVLIGVAILAAMFGGGIAALSDQEVGSGVTYGIMGLAGFSLEWIYMIAFEYSRWGATPGKRLMGLKVTRTSGAPITLQQAVVRNMLRFVDMLPIGGGFGLASCLITRRFQRLGDLAAGTVVIYAEARQAAIEEVDPVVAEAAIHRPMAALTREEQRAVVTFAERAPEWSGERQIELANHAQGLAKVRGPEAVSRLLGMARWIRGAS